MHGTAVTGTAEAVLRSAGLRVTAPRRGVFEALRVRPHSRAEDVFGLVSDTVPGTSLQSVYNALGDFVDVGIARRIEPAGSAGLFELRTDDNHHHLVCSACGTVQDVDCVVGAAPCLTPSNAHGFTVATAEVTFWGLCPSCAADTRTADTRTADPADAGAPGIRSNS